MSWPAEAVHRVIKAYDVRGLVGEQINESFVADVGAAFARLMRDEGARYDPELAYSLYGLVFDLFHRKLGEGDIVTTQSTSAGETRH